MHDLKYLVFNTQICTICTCQYLHYPQHGGESVKDKHIQSIYTTWTIDGKPFPLVLVYHCPYPFRHLLEVAPKAQPKRRILEQKLGSGDGNGCVMVRQCVYDVNVNLQIAHMYQYVFFNLKCTC